MQRTKSPSRGFPGVGRILAPWAFRRAISGSWAARYQGREGPFPRDVDVLVVGDASLRSVRRLCKKVQADLRIEVNPVIVDHHNWNNADPEPFIAQLKDQPLVPIPIAGRS
jgi:hypothetical protein